MNAPLIPKKTGQLASWRSDPFAALRDEMNALRARLLGDEPWFADAVPATDVVETDSQIEVRLDLPGMKPEDVDVQISGTTLTVRGEVREEKGEEKDKTFHRIERRHEAFSRSLTLPCAVDEQRASAEFRQGVLTIALPKAEEAKARKIAVKG